MDTRKEVVKIRNKSLIFFVFFIFFIYEKLFFSSWGILCRLDLMFTNNAIFIDYKSNMHDIQ